MSTTNLPNQTYASLLRRYCSGEDDDDLRTEGAALGEELIVAGVDPVEIKAIHDAAVAEVIDSESEQALVAAHRLLLEVLLSYGVAYSARAERLLAEADERERTRAQGAKHAEQDRLAQLAEVSHELGNPLMVVKVNVASIRRFLEDRGGWPDDLNQREADVGFAVDRMVSLREELLAASRNEQRELEIVPLPLVHILSRAVRWGRINAAGKVQLTEDYASDLPYVLGDDGALNSIFTNLLSNAIRYTPSGGAITVRARANAADVVVEVIDTGVGISADDQLRIYERFYRTEEAKNTTKFGVGLGLAITRDLVTSLRGTIGLESKVGEGSTFTVTLPAASEEDPLVERG